MSTLLLPVVDLQPATLIENLRFTLEQDGSGDYRFRRVRLHERQVDLTVEPWLVDLLEGRTIRKALDLVAGEFASAQAEVLRAVREFLLNLEGLLPATPGSRSLIEGDDPLAATDACHSCAKHRFASMRRHHGDGRGQADQCECRREYRVRNAAREAVSMTVHKMAV